MAKQTVGRTALGAATCRLIEQYQPDTTRLFDDPVVKELVGSTIRFLMQFAAMRRLTITQTEAVARGLFGAQICRARYIDDSVQAALDQGGKQVVILGAGLDTRPYRLPAMECARVFEVDLPGVQKNKVKKIEKYLGHLPEYVTFIPIDFDTQNLESVFAETSFDQSKQAVFTWEGVTQYITEGAVRRTLAFVGKSAPGSILVFTYVLKSVIERRSDILDADHLMDAVAHDSPFIFGLEPSEIPAFLKPFHLKLIDDVGNTYYQEKYLKPIGRKLRVSEAERIAYAIIK